MLEDYSDVSQVGAMVLDTVHLALNPFDTVVFFNGRMTDSDLHLPSIQPDRDDTPCLLH